jgi:very-short-patch-repair endonuclease
VVRPPEATVTLHFNTTLQKQRRRFLRSHLPKAEAVLWTHLSRRQMLGYKFRRQYSVEQYIIDFYCPELKLAIEIDVNVTLPNLQENTITSGRNTSRLLESDSFG